MLEENYSNCPSGNIAKASLYCVTVTAVVHHMQRNLANTLEVINMQNNKLSCLEIKEMKSFALVLANCPVIAH